MVYPYVKNVGVFVCPNKTTGNYKPTLNSIGVPNKPGGYGGNVNLMDWTKGASMASIQDSAGTFLVAEAALCNGVDMGGRTDVEKWHEYATDATDWQITPPSNFTVATPSGRRSTGSWESPHMARRATRADTP